METKLLSRLLWLVVALVQSDLTMLFHRPIAISAWARSLKWKQSTEKKLESASPTWLRKPECYNSSTGLDAFELLLVCNSLRLEGWNNSAKRAEAQQQSPLCLHSDSRRWAAASQPGEGKQTFRWKQQEEIQMYHLRVSEMKKYLVLPDTCD